MQIHKKRTGQSVKKISNRSRFCESTWMCNFLLTFVPLLYKSSCYQDFTYLCFLWLINNSPICD